jgi:hypothetical protein
MIRDVVRLILAAVSALQAERPRFDRGQGSDLPPDGDLARVPASTTRRTELRTALMLFDDETLLKTEALYFYGRDRDLTFRQNLDHLRRLGEPKDWIVTTLLEKLPACAMCFTQAEADLRQEGLSIETVRCRAERGVPAPATPARRHYKAGLSRVG